MSTASSILATLLDSGRYSDLTINCGNKVFKVHRNVVCLQSRPLAAHVDGAFLEGITGEINLPDDEPSIFERLIRFLYTEDFDASLSADELPAPINDDDGKAVDGPLVSLTICTKVYVMAEKYDISALKTLSKAKFEVAVSTEWNTVALSESLRLMYDGLPESDRLLKDVAIKAAASHVKELVNKEEFAALCKGNGDIAFDVLTVSAKEALSPQRCPYCGEFHGNCGSKGYCGKSRHYCSNCGNYFHLDLD